MDIATLDHISALSKLNFTEDEQKEMLGQMTDIIELMDTIKEYDITFPGIFLPVRSHVCFISFLTSS